MNSLEGKRVEIQGYKHDGRMHRIWDSVYCLEDNDEFIAFASKKTKVVEHDFRVWYSKEPAVMIFFKKRWMNVIAMFKKTGITYYVNLASPIIKDNGFVKYIDYDLDLKLYPSSSVKLIDVKEYAYHRELYAYSEDIDKILKYNIQEIKKNMEERVFPFDDSKINELYSKFKDYEGRKNENKIED